MTEVYIDQQRVYMKEGTSLKLTIENTFFQNAGSYTLEVAFPLDIEQNRKVFGAVNRVDVSKRYQTFEAMVIADSRLVFKGTAKVTGVNDREVKLQLLSGNSKVRFWSKASKMYIDEFHYEYTDTNHSMDGWATDEAFWNTPLITAGTFPGKKGVYCYVPVLDENGSAPVDAYKGLWNEQVLAINTWEQTALYHGEPFESMPYYIQMRRDCISPNLMFVAKWIFQHMGYTIARNDVDNVFVNGIYIACARRTTNFRRGDGGANNSADEMSMAKALPHWTVEEFVKQLQNFLNVTVIFDDIKGTVDIIRSAYTDGTVDITGSTEDEYEVEVIDDEDVESNLYDSNVKYKKGASEYHGIDMVEREVIRSFNEIECTATEAQSQWNTMSADDKKMAVWTTGQGQFCAKVTVDGENETLERIRFNHFGGIVRNTANDNDVELKISPVATTTEIDMPIVDYDGSVNIYFDISGPKWYCKQTVLCLQNQYEGANKPTVWDAINGTQQEESEKEDIMQVFLMDDRAVPTGFYHLTFQVPFTHWDYNRPSSSVVHENWSLALANDNSSYSIGSLHHSARSQNRNAEQRFSFISDSIPSVYAVYMLRNKSYACKKLEVHFTAEGMDKLVTGYFEEIL